MKRASYTNQKISILLNKEENERVVRLLGPGCQTLATTVIQLYTRATATYRPTSTHWIKQDAGVLCLVCDANERSYFFRLYCLVENRMIWEHEINCGMNYLAPRSYLHTFETEEHIVAFNFANDNEATHLREILLEKLEYEEANRLNSYLVTKNEGNTRNNSRITYKTLARPASAPVPTMEICSVGKHFKKKSITKGDGNGQPHVALVTGNTNDLMFFENADIPENDSKDMKMFVKQNIKLPTAFVSRPSTSPPSPPLGKLRAPSLSGTSSPVPTKHNIQQSTPALRPVYLPPPLIPLPIYLPTLPLSDDTPSSVPTYPPPSYPPPPPPIPPRNNVPTEQLSAETSSSVPTYRLPTYLPPPPPIPPRNNVPTPPSSDTSIATASLRTPSYSVQRIMHRGSPPLSSRPSAVSIQSNRNQLQEADIPSESAQPNNMPPPPPLPPAILIEKPTLSQSMPFNDSVVRSSAPAPRNGTTLKHVEPETKKSGGDDSRGELLKQILEGVQLKPASSKSKSVNNTSLSNDLFQSLQTVLENRAKVWHSDSSDCSDTDESDHEWDDD